VQLDVFDILALDGEDLRGLPLSLRKTKLARLLARRPDGIFVAWLGRSRRDAGEAFRLAGVFHRPGRRGATHGPRSRAGRRRNARLPARFTQP
jgi:hypothetical protein